MRASIDWGTIGELLWAAPLAGLAVALTYALLIVGAARWGEARRAGATAAATLYGALAVVAGLAFLAVVVEGVRIIVVT